MAPSGVKAGLGAKKEEAGEPYFLLDGLLECDLGGASNDARPYRVTLVNKNWYGVNERYCEIPAAVALSHDSLFDWIEKSLGG